MAAKAKESAKILKARKKLKQQMAEENKHITSQSLEKMSKAIQHWISRHSRERIDLKNKEITFFDENTHSAQPQSRFVYNLLKTLKQQAAMPPPKPLGGRIKTTH